MRIVVALLIEIGKSEKKTFIYRHDKLVVVRGWVGNNKHWVGNVFLL